MNGNPFISRKGELLKRLHVIKYSQEERHDRNPKSPFNQLQAKDGYLIKVLGDWTMRWIWEHREELLLSCKYDGYQIGGFAIHEFYKSVGKEVAEWLTLWITDNSLEELDVDEKSLVRSILNEYVNKTIAGKGIEVPSTLSDRVSMIIEKELWSWIRAVVKTGFAGKDGNGNPKMNYVATGYYYIDTSILEIFRQRLPDLTFKKLGEIIGIEPITNKQGRRVLKCTKNEFIDFINGSDLIVEEQEEPKLGGSSSTTTSESVLEVFDERREEEANR